MAGRIEVAQALPQQLPQPRRLPRAIHRGDRQAPRRAAQAALPAHRRLLLPARRHADRRLLAGRPVAAQRLAARPGRGALSRPRLTEPERVSLNWTTQQIIRSALFVVIALVGVWMLWRFLPALAWAAVLAIATWPLRV